MICLFVYGYLILLYLTIWPGALMKHLLVYVAVFAKYCARYCIINEWELSAFCMCVVSIKRFVFSVYLLPECKISYCKTIDACPQQIHSSQFSSKQ